MANARRTNGGGPLTLRPRTASATRAPAAPSSGTDEFSSELESGLLHATGADQCTVLLAPGWRPIVAKWLRHAERRLDVVIARGGGRLAARVPISLIKVRRRGTTTHVRANLALGGAAVAQITVTTGHARRVRRILRALANAVPRVASHLCLEWLRQEVRAAERRRLAEDLHDGPLQVATAAKIRLQARRHAIQDPTAAAELDEAIRMIGRVVVSLRELMRGRVQSTRARSLEIHLRRAARRWAHLTGLRVMFDFPDHAPDTSLLLSPETVQTVEHVVGEGIVNAWKHGKATRLWVRCRPKNGGLLLTLRDNGQGIRGSPRAEASGGMKMGLRFLRSRITELGGRLDVRAAQGGGTVVETWFP